MKRSDGQGRRGGGPRKTMIRLFWLGCSLVVLCGLWALAADWWNRSHTHEERCTVLSARLEGGKYGPNVLVETKECGTVLFWHKPVGTTHEELVDRLGQGVGKVGVFEVGDLRSDPRYRLARRFDGFEQ